MPKTVSKLKQYKTNAIQGLRLVLNYYDIKHNN